jgi:tryptophan synthase alpha chain
MNRITKHFSQHPEDNLNVYFTAGYPALNDTMRVLKSLQKSGADLVEIGIPYSDPVADGETIQESDEQALSNGITLKLIFEQLKGMRDHVSLPVILMGYINPVLQYGVDNFCRDCAEVGVDGVILPDLPLEVYDREFRHLFEKHGILNLFLITPQTSEKRIRQIDEIGEGFLGQRHRRTRRHQ